MTPRALPGPLPRTGERGGEVLRPRGPRRDTNGVRLERDSSVDCSLETVLLRLL